MDVSNTKVVDRIARVLAAQRLSVNAGGVDESVSDAVDAGWRAHVPDAQAVLRTLREPDKVMATVGDVAIWERMIQAALGE